MADLLALISLCGPCGDPLGDIPQTVEDCLNFCAPLGMGTAEYNDCVEKCVESIEE